MCGDIDVGRGCCECDTTGILKVVVPAGGSFRVVMVVQKRDALNTM